MQEIKDANAFWYKGQLVTFNSLNTLSAGQGYLVKMNTAATITISGIPVQTPLMASLSPGWQIIGYPCTGESLFTPKPISNYYNTTNCQIIKNFDGFWEPGGTNNSISDFEPGKGYFVKF